ncbi:MAG: alpha-galactosidase [Sphingopyxis sp.]|uniref:glycoside hydrolase family 36 protein n=1 Tax=Sphingopyxis sp. TaxID=1908224 RepID=UPI001A390DE6|nr:glycoside hydrolase family 36 protein [Sphingopyxis sp.]MBL9070026.1 alpha-galactosidase [Sphingopyxis sp.]
MSMFGKSGITFDGVQPLLDGVVPACTATVLANGIEWTLDGGGSIVLTVDDGEVTRLDVSATGLGEAPLSLGLRFDAVAGVRRYLRNGYHSWDGSFFADPGTPAGDAPPGKEPTLGFAMTALVPAEGQGAVVLGFDRHDRFQNRFRFGGDASAMAIDVETLLDRTGATSAENLLLYADADVEQALIRWSGHVAAASPTLPRLPEKRIKGWCSWYNLYAAITEENIREHLAAAATYRDAHGADLDIFLIDDGFTPEMGDWLDVKPQFARGMKPLLSEIAGTGFTPGLWIAPFMVGNRSRLYAEHPDWVVREKATGTPLIQMAFYGEFRWHKRSEEYYVLDITHPDAEAYIRRVFRAWAHDWGARYFKTDFMFFGAEYGPDHVVWHEAGLSRIAIWRKMGSIIREEIGDALWLGCGCPLWASVGLVDAIRIGRDVGVKWSGDQSAESLLRDQATRNHAAGRLWQADPDCILLRDRFHDLTDAQVKSLALLAGLSGGVLMTSDHLGELTPDRARLLDALAALDVAECRYPSLGNGEASIVQRAMLADGQTLELRLDPEAGESQCTDSAGAIWP